MNMKTALCSTLLAACGSLQAQVTIDAFTEAQGPFTVGPGEQIDPQVSVLQAPGILGEYRIMLPSMSDDAPLDSTTTTTAGAGEWLCQMDFAAPNDIGDGACAVSYDRGCAERLYDFTAVQAFEIDVAAVSGNPLMVIGVTDRNGVGGFGFLTPLTSGLNSLQRNFIFSSVPGQLIDWSAIDLAAFIVTNDPDFPGLDTSTTISSIGVAGDIQFFEGDVALCEDELVFADGFESAP